MNIGDAKGGKTDKEIVCMRGVWCGERKGGGMKLMRRLEKNDKELYA